MNLGPENHSPSLTQKIVYAGGNGVSETCAAEMLRQLADLVVPLDTIRQYTTRVGQEFEEIRKEAVRAFNENGPPEGSEAGTPPVAVVEMDGGRAQVRKEDQPRGVHGPTWCEPRYASFRSLVQETHSTDPHPEVPQAFLDRSHVEALTEGLLTTRPRTHDPQQNPNSPEPPKHARSRSHKQPKVLLQTCIASRVPAAEFGAMVACEAAQRGFYRSPRKAFIADGQSSNWNIFRDYFPDWTDILDFIHLVAHLFAAARAARPKSPEAWELYVHLVTAAWGGKVEEILARLQRELKRLGPPPEGAGDNHPTTILSKAMGYVQNNATRMNYPEYRRLGFPMTSCYMESLIKRFNFRVKASDKFWISRGLEAVLQIRAAWLSQDGRWERHWQTRAQRVAQSRRHYHRSAA